MKTTDFIKEDFVNDAVEAHQDHEVQMARSDCYNAAKYAIELHKLLKNISEQQGLDGWVSEKITLANDYLRTVTEYLRYEQQAGGHEMPNFDAGSATRTLDSVLGESDYDDAVSAFLAKNKPEQLPFKKPRKSEKTDFGSKHIGGRGEVGRGKGQRIGKAAKTDPSGKPVVSVAEGSVTPNVSVNKIYDDGNTKEWHIYRGEEMIGFVWKNLPDTAEGLYIASGHGPGRGFTEEFTGLKSAVNFLASLDNQGVAEGNLNEFASAGASGSASVATVPGVGKGKDVGSLFGGSYSQTKKKKK